MLLYLTSWLWILELWKSISTRVQFVKKKSQSNQLVHAACNVRIIIFFEKIHVSTRDVQSLKSLRTLDFQLSINDPIGSAQLLCETCRQTRVRYRQNRGQGARQEATLVRKFTPAVSSSPNSLKGLTADFHRDRRSTLTPPLTFLCPWIFVARSWAERINRVNLISLPRRAFNVPRGQCQRPSCRLEPRVDAPKEKSRTKGSWKNTVTPLTARPHGWIYRNLGTINGQLLTHCFDC